MPVRPAVVLTLSYFAPGDTNVFAGPIRQHSNPSHKTESLSAILGSITLGTLKSLNVAKGDFEVRRIGDEENARRATECRLGQVKVLAGWVGPILNPRLADGEMKTPRGVWARANARGFLNFEKAHSIADVMHYPRGTKDAPGADLDRWLGDRGLNWYICAPGRAGRQTQAGQRIARKCFSPKRYME
jgi:hypothetical protein